MGKITVKHYVEKRVKPYLILSDNNSKKLMYPVYVQIIHNKISTHKRSETLINATLDGFNKYQENGIIDKNEFDTMLCCGYTLEKEMEDITNCMKIINDRKISVTRKRIIKLIDIFSDYIGNCLTFIARTVFNEDGNYDEKYVSFILSFDGKSNLLTNISLIKEHTKIDLLPFVKKEDYDRWLAVAVIQSCFRNVSFSKFVHTDYKKILKEKMKSESVGKFEMIVKEIDNMIENFISWHSKENTIDEKFLP